jgi:hypothetical protein
MAFPNKITNKNRKWGNRNVSNKQTKTKLSLVFNQDRLEWLGLLLVNVRFEGNLPANGLLFGLCTVVEPVSSIAMPPVFAQLALYNGI